MKKTKKLLLSLLMAAVFSFITAQNVDYSAVALTSAMPGGATVGMKLYTDGLLVVGVSDISTGGITYSPAKQAGISKGDRITHINDRYIESVSDFINVIQQNGTNPVSLTVVHGEGIVKKSLSPVFYSETNEFKAGMWVRDSTAGIGTVSFILSDGSFAALGHGISDVDTGEIITIKRGEIVGSRVMSVLKGERGAAGELRGAFSDGSKGVIFDNCDCGIYGKLEKTTISCAEMEIATENEVTEGAASIYSNIEGSSVENFSVIIERILGNHGNDGKNMVIRVNDQRLIDKTGGIVQGMSGSPIIQNGKIVGAVTHVFLDEPTLGYGIFASKMLDKLTENSK